MWRPEEYERGGAGGEGCEGEGGDEVCEEEGGARVDRLPRLLVVPRPQTPDCTYTRTVECMLPKNLKACC